MVLFQPGRQQARDPRAKQAAWAYTVGWRWSQLRTPSPDQLLSTAWPTVDLPGSPNIHEGAFPMSLEKCSRPHILT